MHHATWIAKLLHGLCNTKEICNNERLKKLKKQWNQDLQRKLYLVEYVIVNVIVLEERVVFTVLTYGRARCSIIDTIFKFSQTLGSLDDKESSRSDVD